MMNSIVNAQFNLGEYYKSPWGQQFGLGELLSLTLNILIAIAGILFIFIIIIAGYNVISGAGNNDPKAAAQGKQAITYVIIGFVITSMAYFILRFVELILVADFVTGV